MAWKLRNADLHGIDAADQRGETKSRTETSHCGLVRDSRIAPMPR
jgi:hypothetical protein